MRLYEIEMINDVASGSKVFPDMVRRWHRFVKLYGRKSWGNLKNFEVFSLEEVIKENIICLKDKSNDQLVLIVEISAVWINTNTWQIDLISVNDNYRGLNLPILMYRFLLKNLKLKILSGNEQTKGGRSIWERLVKIQGIDCFGYDMKSNKLFQIDKNDLFNEDIWNNNLTDEIDYIQDEIENTDNKNKKQELTKQLERYKIEQENISNNIRILAVAK
jgi:hypothetical protein